MLKIEKHDHLKGRGEKKKNMITEKNIENRKAGLPSNERANELGECGISIDTITHS